MSFVEIAACTRRFRRPRSDFDVGGGIRLVEGWDSIAVVAFSSWDGEIASWTWRISSSTCRSRHGRVILEERSDEGSKRRWLFQASDTRILRFAQDDDLPGPRLRPTLGPATRGSFASLRRTIYLARASARRSPPAAPDTSALCPIKSLRPALRSASRASGQLRLVPPEEERLHHPLLAQVRRRRRRASS